MINAGGEFKMNVINFKQAKLLKEEAIEKLDTLAIQMKIPTNEVSYWIQALTFMTHSVGFFLQKATDKREIQLLQKEYGILSDLMEKALVFNGIDVSDDIGHITFSLTYEEMIILEGQLEQFLSVCDSYQDLEYMRLTEKYLNTLFKVMDEQAEMIDLMTKSMIKITNSNN